MFPFAGLLVRLLHNDNLNGVLTIFYTIIYWVPYHFARRLYVYVKHRGRKAVFRNPTPSFVQEEFYDYDPKTDIYYSRQYSNLDDKLEEWGWVEYTWVYNIVSSKLNDSGTNFQEGLHAHLLRLAKTQGGPIRCLDIGQGPGNSTYDLACAVAGSVEICCLDISEKLIHMSQKLVPGASYFKGSMECTGFESESFDLIINWGGINETSIELSLAEMHRIAKPGAFIIIGDENFSARGFWHKLACTAFTNMTYMDSYFLDLSSSDYLAATRPDKESMRVISEFFKQREAEIELISSNEFDGIGYAVSYYKKEPDSKKDQ